MNKLPISSLALLIMLCSCGLKNEAKPNEVANTTLAIHNDSDKLITKETNEDNIVKVDYQSEIETQKEEIKEDKRPDIPDINLESNILDYMYKISDQYDISYTLALATASVESTFQADVVSPAGCVGLMQLSPRTAKDIAKKLGLKKYDLKDAKDSILFGIYYLNYLRNYWQDKGYSEEDVYALSIVSYNQGPSNVLRMLKSKYNIEKNSYYKKVDKMKMYYEGLIADAE